MNEELAPMDYDCWHLLLHIAGAPNRRRSKKVIYKKWLHLLFKSEMSKFVITDTRYMYLTDAGRACLFEIALGKRKISFDHDQKARAIKKGDLVRGNQGWQFQNWSSAPSHRKPRDLPFTKLGAS